MAKILVAYKSNTFLYVEADSKADVREQDVVDAWDEQMNNAGCSDELYEKRMMQCQTGSVWVALVAAGFNLHR